MDREKYIGYAEIGIANTKSLQAIQSYRIDRSDLDAILGGNISRLLNLTATPVSH
jgi:hypothetical protein